MRVVVTGAAGAIGRRVVARLADHDDLTVLAVDKVSQVDVDLRVDTKQLDLAEADLVSLFAGADSVVHLASAMTAGSGQVAEAELELAVTRRVLDAMAVVDIGHLLIVSSAMVYTASRVMVLNGKSTSVSRASSRAEPSSTLLR